MNRSRRPIRPLRAIAKDGRWSRQHSARSGRPNPPVDSHCKLLPSNLLAISRLKISRFPNHRHFAGKTSPQPNRLRAVQRNKLVGEGRLALGAAPTSRLVRSPRPARTISPDSVRFGRFPRSRQRHRRDYRDRKQRSGQPTQKLMRAEDQDRDPPRFPISSGSRRKYTCAACETIRICRANSPAAENSSKHNASRDHHRARFCDRHQNRMHEIVDQRRVHLPEQTPAHRVERAVGRRDRSQPRLQPLEHLLVALIRRADSPIRDSAILPSPGRSICRAADARARSARQPRTSR